MARLEVNLLGGFQATLDSGGLCTLPTRKAEALLAYLALAPQLEKYWNGRVMPPDRVMFRIVPEHVRSWGL